MRVTQYPVLALVFVKIESVCRTTSAPEAPLVFSACTL
jgi:hypothetical protein